MIVAAAWVIPAILGAVDVVGQHAVWGGKLQWNEVVFTSVDWLMYGAFTPAIFGLSERWPLTRGTLARNVPRHVIVSLLFCVAWATGGTVMRVILDPDMRKPGALEHWY